MEVIRVEDAVSQAVILSDLSGGRVEMWTTRRLPFEPTGALLEARNKLREQLQKLTVGQHEWLEAKYLSIVQGFVDTENVLLYNVGTSALATASSHGLRFSREFSTPPAMTFEGASFPWQHYHLYCRGVANRFQPTGPPPFVHFSFRLPALSSSLKPHDYWWPAKQSLVHSSAALNTLPGGYKAALTLSGSFRTTNIAALVKPMFDGVISALHFDPSPDNVVCQLLAGKLRVSPNAIVEALSDPRNTVLGCRRVVSPYRSFVKWNPADELCLVGELAVDLSNARDCTVTVEISPIA